VVRKRLKTAAVILAAGKGVRMNSDLPKVLHDIHGRPMVAYVIDTVRSICEDNIYMVVGYDADRVMAACRESGVGFVLQEEQLGTGHAVLQCEEVLSNFQGTVVVLNGDVPCLKTKTIEDFIAHHRSEGAAATVMTAVLDDPSGYGRILRDGDGGLLRIVEQKDATESEREIREINSGLFCFEKDDLFPALRETNRENVQGEYYVTDVIEVIKRRGKRARAFRAEDPAEVSGVNTVRELENVRNLIRENSR
jgi:UDP-N-acetylglucosamine diphosphorylase/glucosamine-1-phosphate N-acetyltransferase